MKTTLPLGFPAHPQWVRIPFPVPACLALRAAGDMRRGTRTRPEFYQLMGIQPDDVHVVGQVHSRTVVTVPTAEERTPDGEHFTPGADGLITADPDVILGVTVADCMPIFLHDATTGARGLLHSGWHGTGILDVAIHRLQSEFGCMPGDLVVTMGPCISVESYQVNETRASAFAAEWGEASVRITDEGHYLNLHAANQEICRRNGVDRINVMDHCTVPETRLASYRRDGPDAYTLMLALLGGRLNLGDT
jgi:purine-nucleoside/S-methyl-5'-thioadenosine phosphorylase / adenosine deaminase